MTIRQALNNVKKDYKGALIVLGFVGSVFAALYPITIYPYLHIKEYKEEQSTNWKGLNREKIQPSNMRVWSDPFAPRDD